MSIDEFLDGWLREHVKPVPSEQVDAEAARLHTRLCEDAGQHGWTADDFEEAYSDFVGYIAERIEAANAAARRHR